MRANSLIRALCLAALLAAGPIDASVAKAPTAWREAFQSSPVATGFKTDADFDAFAQRLKIPPQIALNMRPRHFRGTVRYRLIVSIAGAQLRIRISNELGTTPLRLSSVSVAKAGPAFDAVSGSVRPVTFGGSHGVEIPAGAPALSDPVDLPVAAGGGVLVSIHGPDEFILGAAGGNASAVAAGDQTLAERLVSPTPVGARPIVTSISVLAPASTGVIVALGDSITDGNRAEIGALHSWPEQLARRLAAHAGSKYAVVNAGIGGNRILAPAPIPEMGVAALARLDRDVLRVEGLTHIIVLEGTNDIGLSGASIMGDSPKLAASDLIAGYRQIMARAHIRNVRVDIGTILPFGGSPSHSSPEKEALRQAVNRWIRTSGEPDAVVDFDAAIRDPSDPSRIQARFDSGDHLHPNEAGSKAMGDAIDLADFE